MTTLCSPHKINYNHVSRRTLSINDDVFAPKDVCRCRIFFKYISNFGSFIKLYVHSTVYMDKLGYHSRYIE
jgi:hypothetical protein